MKVLALAGEVRHGEKQSLILKKKHKRSQRADDTGRHRHACLAPCLYLATYNGRINQLTSSLLLSPFHFSLLLYFCLPTLSDFYLCLLSTYFCLPPLYSISFLHLFFSLSFMDSSSFPTDSLSARSARSCPPHAARSQQRPQRARPKIRRRHYNRTRHDH